MLDITPGHPRYAVVVARHHLRLLREAGGRGTLDQRRQLARLVIKLIYAADPGGLETRHDVKVLRRWWDLLNAADRVARTKAGIWRTASVPPLDAAAIAIGTDEFGARALALRLRSASDGELLYERLVQGAAAGRRGAALRAAVDAECAARPWLGCEVGA